MSWAVFALVTLAAAIHVAWNALVKTCGDQRAFALLTSLTALAALLPGFLARRLLGGAPLPPALWAWAALSGLFEALYTLLLFRAYRSGDLSIVYPVSRGTAPLATLAVAGVWLGDGVTWPQGLAVMVVVLGVLGLARSSGTAGRWRPAGLVPALLTGLTIAAYHLVDRRAMLLAGGATPYEYLLAVQLCTTAGVALGVLLPWRARPRLKAEWQAHRWGVLAVGVGTPLAYFLILLALQMGNVTLVTAGRNVGIVLSALVGGLVFREPVGPLRWGAALVVTLGLAGLVLAGSGR